MKGVRSMSNKTVHPSRDFSRFDAMSTEELKELLYQDSLLSPEQETDMDAILYIMEVVAKREAVEHPEDSPSTEEALAAFRAFYRTEDGDAESLYEEDDEDTTPILTAVPQPPQTEYGKPRKNIRYAVRTVIVAAILVVIVLCASLIASASGRDFWGALAQWGKDTFGFNSHSIPLEKESLYPETNDPRDILLKYNISTPLLPTWMPEGYEFHEIEFMETPTRTVFYIWYINETDEIGMTIAVLSSTPARAYEKDGEDSTIYQKNGVDHYIITNLDETTIVWTVGNIECSIRGPISAEEARNIIDSIYRS